MNFNKLIQKVASALGRPKQQSLPAHFHFRGYQLPERLVHLTGSGPDVFEILSDNQIRYFKAFTGLQPQHHVVEVGCGIGKGAIPLTQYLTSATGYLGIDVIADSIAWCSAEITRRHPNFRFVHFDVKDKLHHPGGRLNKETSVFHKPTAPLIASS